MSGFALNLDLTVYFQDLRKYSCVFVDLSKCKKVRDVENHIKSVFKMEDNICLTNKKFLIPRCEDIQILQQYETLKVQKCDFFDEQIHKNKRANPVCDQIALNLIQSERSIDLSCRPKQRLKINIGQDYCVSGAPFVESRKVIIRPSSSSNNILNEVCQTECKEKQKNKKKKYSCAKFDEDLNDVAGNGVDILDMSVKRSKRKNYENGFSTEGLSELEVGTSSKLCGQNKRYLSQTDNDYSINERSKKSRKQKKQSLPLHEDLDLASSCLNSMVSDNTVAKTDNVKKNKRKVDNVNIEETNIVTDFSHNVEKTVVHISTMCEENSDPKKFKKTKRSVDIRETPNNNQDAQDCLDRNQCSKEEYKSIETNVINTKSCKNEVLNEDISKKQLDEYKSKVIEKFDHFIGGIKSAKCTNQVENPNNKLSEINQQDHISNIREHSTINEENAHNDEHVSFPASLETKLKKKRIRKHNKKKKKEKEVYLLSVGSVLNKLTSRLQECPSQPPLSEAAKHIFFKDDDIAQNENVSLSTSVQSQTVLQGSPVPRDEVSSQVQENQVAILGKSPGWQDKLLSLASSNYKPIVFHRTNLPIQFPQKLATDSNLLPNVKVKNLLNDSGTHVASDEISSQVQENQEVSLSKSSECSDTVLKHLRLHSEPVIFHRSTSTSYKTNLPIQTPQKIVSQSNLLSNLKVTNLVNDSDITTCNGDIDNIYENVNKVGEKTQSVVEKKVANNADKSIRSQITTSDAKNMLDNGILIVNGVQNIDLTKYPVIDSVCDGDFILFKVLKLNENNEPNLSKTVLAKVNDATYSPEKICLEIVDGWEECDAYDVTENDKVFTITLRLTDMIEPRLFHP